MLALRVGIVLEVTEAGGGVANLRMASGRTYCTTGKHSHCELKRRLNALSVALQEAAEASHLSPEILNVKKRDIEIIVRSLSRDR